MKAQLQPYSLPEEQFVELAAWVLSMQRSPDRRDSISKQLTEAAFPFEIIDAIDGQEELDETEVGMCSLIIRDPRRAPRNVKISTMMCVPSAKSTCIRL